MTRHWLLLLALLLLLKSARAAPCDMSALAPILASADMTKCADETSIAIPISGGSSLYVTEDVCENPSCGKAITAIRALALPECELTTEACGRGGCVDVSVALNAEHLDVVSAACPNGVNVQGTKAPASADAMDATKKCTAEGIRSVVWDVYSHVTQCLGKSLEDIVDPKEQDSESAQAFMACYRCTNLSAEIGVHKLALPTCQLPFNASFSAFLTDVLAFCDAKSEYERTNHTNAWFAQHLMDETATCGYQKLYTYYTPVQKRFDTCTIPLMDPSRAPDAMLQNDVCSRCPQAASAFQDMAVPKCKLPFGMNYREFIQSVYSECLPTLELNTTSLVTGSGSTAGVATSDSSNSSDKASSDTSQATKSASSPVMVVARSLLLATTALLALTM